MEKSYVSESSRFGVRTIGVARKGVKGANLRDDDLSVYSPWQLNEHISEHSDYAPWQ